MNMECKIWNDGNVTKYCAGWGFEIFLLQIDGNEIENKDEIKNEFLEYPMRIILLLPRTSEGRNRKYPELENSKLYDAVEVNNPAKTQEITGAKITTPELRSKYIGKWLKDKGYIKDCRNPKDYVEEGEFIFKFVCKSDEEAIFKLVAVKIEDNVIEGEDLFKDKQS
jgi:hypothetical protein